MSLKGDNLLRDILDIPVKDATDEINRIKPEIIEYLKRDILKEKRKNITLILLLIMVFALLIFGGVS